jgi:hypothetical protein
MMETKITPARSAPISRENESMYDTRRPNPVLTNIDYLARSERLFANNLLFSIIEEEECYFTKLCRQSEQQT